MMADPTEPNTQGNGRPEGRHMRDNWPGFPLFGAAIVIVGLIFWPAISA